MSKAKLSIYCVDDDRISRVMMGNILKEYECTLIESGEDCLTQLKQNEPDLILLDIEMPGLSGLETCKQIRSLGFENVLIVFLSANNSLPERLKGYQVGGDDFIHKPFDINELLNKVNAVISKKHLLDKAHQTIKDTNQSATNAIQTLGETGLVVHFLQSTFDCNSYDSLAQKIIHTHKQLGLTISLEISLNEERLHYNLQNPLEKSVFEYARHRGRLVSSGKHTIVNYQGVSIFIKNMPIENSELCGRIRDYIAIIGQGAESKIKALKVELFAKDQRQTLIDFISDLAKTVNRIDMAHIEQQNQQENILTDLFSDIEDAFSELEMSEKQEKGLRNILNNSAQQTLSLHDNGLIIDKEFKLILDDLNTIVQQSDKQYEDIIAEQEEPEVFEESDDDVLFF